MPIEMVSVSKRGCLCKRRVGIWPDAEISGKNAQRFYDWAVNECSSADDILIIDLAKVEYVSAAGLTAMLNVAKFAVLRGINIVWKNMNPNTARLIWLAGLDKVIEIDPHPTP
jgi:anti-anti-sigma factor